MRLEFIGSGGAVLHEIGEDAIEKWTHSGRKLIAQDYFMNEPASVKLTIVEDSWLAGEWESQMVKINNSLWLKHVVRVYQRSMISGYEELLLTGLVLLTESEHSPFEHRMQIAVYDYSALISDLDIPVRIYYPWRVGEGTDWTRYLINYRLPGEGENEAPEGETGAGTPQWFPYLHTIETPDRQVSSILQALTQIWRESFAENWDLSFSHAYGQEEPGMHWVNNNLVRLGEADSFYNPFVMGLVNSAYVSLHQETGIGSWQFWANYGFVPASRRLDIYQEYGMFFIPIDCDGFFVMRAGYSWGAGGKDIANPHGGWTDGEGGGSGSYAYWREWFRIYVVKNGECILETGQKGRYGTGQKLGDTVGTFDLSPFYALDVAENSFYRCTETDFYHIPPPFDTADIMQFFYAQTYYVYFTGNMEGGGWIGNRIFRMKNQPRNPGQEQYIEQKARDWFKTMLFVGDLSCYADASGLLQIVPRQGSGELELPWENLISGKKQLLVYQPWDETKLGEVINDAAEIRYLIEYYGGARVLSHELELRFAQRGWATLPELRQRFELNASESPAVALLGSGWYIVVEISFDAQKTLKMRVVRG